MKLIVISVLLILFYTHSYASEEDAKDRKAACSLALVTAKYESLEFTPAVAQFLASNAISKVDIALWYNNSSNVADILSRLSKYEVEPEFYVTMRPVPFLKAKVGALGGYISIRATRNRLLRILNEEGANLVGVEFDRDRF